MYRITVICTDRGQHPRTWLCAIDIDRLTWGHELHLAYDHDLGAHAAKNILRCAWIEHLTATGEVDATHVIADSIDDSLRVALVDDDPALYGRPPHHRVHLRCVRCRRHVQWLAPKAIEISTALLSAGVSELDLSMVP